MEARLCSGDVLASETCLISADVRYSRLISAVARSNASRVVGDV